MSIYLIRHGKTEANIGHRYCGSTDLPLCEEGREELSQRHYAVPENTRYVTSGMKRCNETLELLFGQVPHTVDRELREIDFGCFEMKSYAELREDPCYQAWITGDNHRNVPPGGESGEAMTARVLRAYDRYAKTGENTVILTHGGVIAAIMESLFPGEEKNRYQWQPKPGCGYVISEKGYQVLS